MKLVLVSGWGAGPEVWEPVAERMPGYDIERVPWWDCLDGDGFATEGAVVGGWSLGALLALRAAMSRDVAGVVLVSGTARFLSDDGYIGADARALRAMSVRLRRQPERVLADFADLCIAPGQDGVFRQAFVERAMSVGVERLAAGLGCLEATDLRAGLGNVTARTLVVHGQSDQVIPVASARALADGLPAARLVAAPDAPHALLHVLPEVVAREMESFVNGL